LVSWSGKKVFAISSNVKQIYNLYNKYPLAKKLKTIHDLFIQKLQNENVLISFEKVIVFPKFPLEKNYYQNCHLLF